MRLERKKEGFALREMADWLVSLLVCVCVCVCLSIYLFHPSSRLEHLIMIRRAA